MKRLLRTLKLSNCILFTKTAHVMMSLLGLSLQVNGLRNEKIQSTKDSSLSKGAAIAIDCICYLANILQMILMIIDMSGLVI